MSNNHTNMVLSQGNRLHYPIEKMIKTISAIEGSYTIALVDFPREQLPTVRSRGGTDSENEDDGDAEEEEDQTEEGPVTRGNCMMFFPCKPNKTCPKDSTLVDEFWRRVDATDKSDDKIVLPGKKIQLWKPCGGKGVKEIEVDQELEFYIADE